MIQNHAERRREILRLQKTPPQLFIIGGGIVGSGIARSAAMRGVRSVLAEQHDFAFGTSSRSTRLIHGGLRYLAQGRIGLVRESSIEKCIIQEIAPHLTSSLAFIFPTYQAPPWDQWALWKLRIGVRIYDVLCSGRNLGRSRSITKDRLISMLPEIGQKRLTGGVRYFDGLTNDSRLVIDTLRSAAGCGARVFNYCRVVSAEYISDAWRLVLEDKITGDTFEVNSPAVVNATGPWGEQFAHSAVRLRLTKGVHLVICRERLPVPDAVVVTEGSRILFAIPWGERVILGTTDTDYEGPPEDVSVDAEDIEYILATIGRSFPGVKLQKKDVVSAWAGLRPLIADPKGNPSDIDRSHKILYPKPGWWDVAGGKLTTYRLMAEQVTDRVERFLGRSKTEDQTAVRPLLPIEETHGISSITPPEPSRELVEHFCLNEWAVHLDDVMLRRSSWGSYRLDACELAERASEWMGGILGWDSVRKQEELSRFTDSVSLL